MSHQRDAWTEAVTKGTVGRLSGPYQRRSKYSAVKVTVDGITFHSKREAQRWHELKLLQKAGKIEALELQPAYMLSVRNGSGEVSLGIYRADFRYWQGGDVVVEDVKGYDVPLGKWKRKHCEAQYGITVRLIR